MTGTDRQEKKTFRGDKKADSKRRAQTDQRDNHSEGIRRQRVKTSTYRPERQAFRGVRKSDGRRQTQTDKRDIQRG